jgi:RHS repeat-associated protein
MMLSEACPALLGATYYNTYDNNGNTTSKTDSTGTTNYTWDFENRLSSVTLPGTGGTVTFKYDPFGRRIYKSSSWGTSIFAYDGDNLVEETNSSGSVVARYSQGLDIDEPLAMLRSSTTSYYDADGLGSITSLSSSAGSLAQTYGYDSFGKQTSSSGSLTNPFQYTARESDPETGLYYYRFRYYDSNFGRFITEDPIGLRGGVNFYRYVVNNPTTLSDPFGLQEDKNWVFRWGNRFLRWWLDPPKPGAPQPNPVNICEAGQTDLFWELGPNPYYNDKTRNNTAALQDWETFRSLFLRRCEAAKKPGKITITFCTQGATPLGGPFAYCMCCEDCEKKK